MPAFEFLWPGYWTWVDNISAETQWQWNDVETESFLENKNNSEFMNRIVHHFIFLI